MFAHYKTLPRFADMLIRHLVFFLTLCVTTSLAQELNYVVVQDSAGNRISNVSMANSNGSIRHFTNNEGIGAIQDSIKGMVWLSRSGYLPKKVPLENRDSTFYILEKLPFYQLSNDRLIKGRKMMTSVFEGMHVYLKRYRIKAFQMREMDLTEVPFEVKGVSGRVIPSREEIGKVYAATRYSDYSRMYADKTHERLLTTVDSGLFNEMSERSFRYFYLNLFHRDIDVYPLSNLHYKSPLNMENVDSYNYYLQDSVQLESEWAYRVYIEPQKKDAPLFTGYAWVSKERKIPMEVHLKLYKNNHIQFTDSLSLSGYSTSINGDVHPTMQWNRASLNLLGYKFKLNVKNLILDFDWNHIPDSIQKSKFEVLESPHKQSLDSLDFDERMNGGESVFEDSTLSHGIKSSSHVQNWIFKRELDFFKSLVLTGNDYTFRKGYFSFHPLLLSIGYNTVEGVYLNVRGTYHLHNDHVRFRLTPYMRYGFNSQTFYPKIETSLDFNFQDPVKLYLAFGQDFQQFNQLEPLDPFINSLYSFFLGRNYLKAYEKNFVKFLFNKEIMRGLEMVLSFEVAQRKALFNTTDYSLFGLTDRHTPNNPDHPPIITSEDGFETHWSNTIHMQLFYQFGRRYSFKDNKLKKLESSLPRARLEYRKGMSYREGMPDYDMIALGVGSKTRIRNFGLLESDLTFGSFINDDLVHFADYKHFNGVQTAFINRTWDGWTDVRQFSTLPYYDYSTDGNYWEFHVKHQFQGWLFSRIGFLKKYQWHSYIGYNYLLAEEIGSYNEWYFGIENVLKVVNIQAATGVDYTGKVKFAILLGVNFNYTYYFDSRNKKYN